MPQFQLIPKAMGFGEQLGMGLGSGLGEGLSSALNQMLQQKQNRQQLEGLAPIFKQFGLPDEGISALIKSGLDPKTVATMAGQLGQQQVSFAKEQEKAKVKKEEKAAPYRASLDALNRQRELLKAGHLGPKFGVTGGLSERPKFLSTLTKAGRKDRAEYERLGKSLIQQSANIPIRNRQEFETLAHGLFDPNMSTAEIEGNLDAMERIIKNSLPQENKGMNEEIFGKGKVILTNPKTGEQFYPSSEKDVKEARAAGWRVSGG